MSENLTPLRVTTCPHPFKVQHETHHFSPTLSLAQVLQEIQPDLLLGRYAHIWVNDTYVPPEKWKSTYPEAGSDIAIRVVPGKKKKSFWGTIGSVFLAIAVIAVAAITTWATFGALGPVWATALGSLAGMAVGIVGNMALNALFPPVQPGGAGTLSSLAAVPGVSDYGQSSSTLSITGASNKANLWGPVPFILGRYRVFPFYGARVFTESAGDDQYLRLFFVCGVK